MAITDVTFLPLLLPVFQINLGSILYYSVALVLCFLWKQKQRDKRSQCVHLAFHFWCSQTILQRRKALTNCLWNPFFATGCCCLSFGCLDIWPTGKYVRLSKVYIFYLLLKKRFQVDCDWIHHSPRSLVFLPMSYVIVWNTVGWLLVSLPCYILLVDDEWSSLFIALITGDGPDDSTKRKNRYGPAWNDWGFESN